MTDLGGFLLRHVLSVRTVLRSLDIFLCPRSFIPDGNTFICTQPPELCQSRNLIPLFCFSETLAKITVLQISFGLPWYMIYIHAIQFLIEIIYWTSLLLAGNFCSGIQQERGKMFKSGHTLKALKTCSKIVCL